MGASTADIARATLMQLLWLLNWVERGSDLSASWNA